MIELDTRRAEAANDVNHERVEIAISAKLLEAALGRLIGADKARHLPGVELTNTLTLMDRLRQDIEDYRRALAVARALADLAGEGGE